MKWASSDLGIKGGTTLKAEKLRWQNLDTCAITKFTLSAGRRCFIAVQPRL
jgi:hypothetical protein